MVSKCKTAKRRHLSSQQIGKQYVRSVDSKMAKISRKVLFIVDNFPGHSKIYNLEAVTVEFLPANMTSVLQLMGQGVIEVARKLDRKSLLQ